MENDLYKTTDQSRSQVKLMIEQGEPAQLIVREIPYNYLVFNPAKTVSQVMKHCSDVFLTVSLLLKTNSLYGPHIRRLAEQKNLQLPPQTSNKIVLFLAVEGTLLELLPAQDAHSAETLNIFDKEVKFMLRPYCLEFLKGMSQYFELVLYSSLDKNTTAALTQFLNTRASNSIAGYFWKDHCVKVTERLLFKDLRAVRNRSQNRMVLLTASIVNVGVVLDSCIPIVGFRLNLEDRELLHIQNYLIGLSQCEDALLYNRQYLRLADIVNVKSTHPQPHHP